MAAPPTPLLISGHVYSPRGIIDNVTVTATYGDDSTSTTTNSSGEYALDLSGIASDGNTVTITANKSGWGTKSESVVASDTPQIQDFYLVQEDKDYYPSEQDRYTLQFTIPCDYDGNPVNLENPLSVQDRPLTKKIENNANSQPLYIGEAAPGTPTDEARWRIQQLEYDGTAITGQVWANGNAEFDKTWDDRATYDYS